nr:putative carbohydrate binding domain containing protein [uncultured Mediterranean phage uvMED]
MSEIKVNSIKGVGASAAAITVNNTDGTCTANITNNLSNRNLIINGAMQVAQRGTSSTISGYGTVDRMNQHSGSTDEAPTFAQVDVAAGTTPYTLGFRKAFKITNGNQTSGAGTSDYVYVQTILEGQDIANSGWNYLSASSYITISYWIKSSVAQNFYGVITSSDGTAQAYVWETGSLSADTWTKITKTIPGNSNLTFDNDNGAGMYFSPVRAFDGTARTGSMSLNSWAAYSGSARTPDQTSTWYTTNDATLEITGVQLEVGSVATDFEHKSYAQDLLLCQRYYEVHYQSAGTASMYSTGDGTIKYSHTWYFHQCKRAQASVSLINSGYFNASGGSAITLTGIFTSKNHCMFYSNSNQFRLLGNAQVALVKAESEL